jgi:diamine N-acetyltransferase
MSLVTIRYATIDDAEMIADISRQTFYDTFASENTAGDMDKFMNEKFTKEALMKEVGAPGNIFFMAVDDDKVLGYVRMRDNQSIPELPGKNVIEIARIYAAANAIGKGIGKMLMQKCIDIAVEMKKEIIWLGVWEKNQRAIDFYTQWGFEKFGTHIFLLGDDPQTDWLMKKPLISP